MTLSQTRVENVFLPDSRGSHTKIEDGVGTPPEVNEFCWARRKMRGGERNSLVSGQNNLSCRDAVKPKYFAASSP